MNTDLKVGVSLAWQLGSGCSLSFSQGGSATTLCNPGLPSLLNA